MEQQEYAPSAEGYLSVMGLLPAYDMSLGAEGHELDPQNIYSTGRSFHDAGVAYPAIRLGWLGDGKALGGPDPQGAVFNPFLIRPERLTRVQAAVEALGLGAFFSEPSWWTKTDVDSRITAAFWDEVPW
jgi:hypothetical protein